MTNRSYDEQEKQMTESAWSRLEAKLGSAAPSPVWAEWDRKAAEVLEAAAGSREALLAQAGAERANTAAPTAQRVPMTAAEAANPSRPRKRRRKLTVRIAAAAAAALIAGVVLTPAANEALASFLNKFRMEQVVVVDEDGLRGLLEKLGMENGKAMNRFGVFHRATEGEYRYELTAQEAAQASNLPLPVIPGVSQESLTYGVAPARSITLQINVDEVNAAMAKLGAAKLLPDAVDGKPITLRTGVELYTSYHEEQEGGLSFWFDRMPVPTIEFDPSIDTRDAFDALIRFPALPDDIREAVIGATALEDGKLPIPIFAEDLTDELTIGGTTVYIERASRYTVNRAMWVKDGVLTEVGSHQMTNAAFDALVTELVGG